MHVSEELRIGDWCFFYQKEITPIADIASYFDNIVIGALSGFQYIEGRTEKSRQYSLDFAPVKASDNSEHEIAGENTNRGINVSATWYRFDNEFKLQPMDICHFFINIKNYIATTSSPILESSSKSYKIVGHIAEIKEQLNELTCNLLNLNFK